MDICDLRVKIVNEENEWSKNLNIAQKNEAPSFNYCGEGDGSIE